MKSEKKWRGKVEMAKESGLERVERDREEKN